MLKISKKEDGVIEIARVHKGFWEGWKDVIWIWRARTFGFSYKQMKIYGQHRLHFGWVCVWWGMFHEVRG